MNECRKYCWYIYIYTKSELKQHLNDNIKAKLMEHIQTDICL